MSGVTPVSSGDKSVEISKETLHDRQELFGRTCQACHNSRGIGGKCPTQVRGAWSPGGANSYEFVFTTIRDGRPDTLMGAFGEIFSKDEIWTIVHYIRYEAARIQEEDKNAQSQEEYDDRR